MHNKIDGDFLGFQVAHVDNPDTVDTTFIGQIQLLTQFRHSSGVDPTIVPGTAIHINMVIEAKTTLTFPFKFATFTANISPVVVTEQQRHVVRNSKTCVIIALYLRKDSP